MAFVGAGGVVSTRKVVPKRVASSLRVRVAGRKFRPPPVENPDKAVIPSEVDLLGWEPEPIEEDEFAAVARTAAEAADERKGRNIVALRVARLTHTTTFFVYITGGSGPQLRAIVNLVRRSECELERTRNQHAFKLLAPSRSIHHGFPQLSPLSTSSFPNCGMNVLTLDAYGI